MKRSSWDGSGGDSSSGMNDNKNQLPGFLLRRTVSLPDLTSYHSQIPVSVQAPIPIIMMDVQSSMSAFHNDGQRDLSAAPRPIRSLLSPINRTFQAKSLPRVPEDEESSLTHFQFSSPPPLPLRQIPARTSHQSFDSTTSYETTTSVPSFAYTPTESSPSINSQLDHGPHTARSNGSGTFGHRANMARGDSYVRPSTLRHPMKEKENIDDYGVRHGHQSVEEWDQTVSSPGSHFKTSTSTRSADRRTSSYFMTSKALQTHRALLKGLESPTIEDRPFETHERGFLSPSSRSTDIIFDSQFLLGRADVVSFVSTDNKLSNVPSQGEESSSFSETDIHSIFATRGANRKPLSKGDIARASNVASSQSSSASSQQLVLTDTVVKQENNRETKSVFSVDSRLRVPDIPQLHSAPSPSVSLNGSRSEVCSESSSVHPYTSSISRSPALSVRSFGPYNHHSGLNLDLPAHTIHRSASMTQVTLVAQEDMANIDDEVCVICCESLHSLYRLAGEKPNVTSTCGHSLHHVSEIDLVPII